MNSLVKCENNNNELTRPFGFPDNAWICPGAVSKTVWVWKFTDRMERKPRFQICNSAIITTIEAYAFKKTRVTRKFNKY